MKLNKSYKKLNFISIIILTFYSIALVVYVNDPVYTYIENYFAYIVLINFSVYFFLFRKIYIPKIFLGFFIFLLLSFFVLIFYPNQESFDLLYSLVQIFIFSIIVYNILIFTNTSISIEIGIIIGLLYSIFVGYYFGRDYFSGFVTQRYFGTLTNPNHYSFMLTMSLLLLVRRFLLMKNFSNKKSIYTKFRILLIFLMFIFCIEVVFYSISRQGMLIVLFLLSFLFYQTFKESSLIRRLLIISFSVYLSIFTFQKIVNDELIYKRVVALFSLFSLNDNVQLDNSLIYRTKYLSDAFNLWTENPVLGVGLHQFKHVNQSGVSHNNFLEILVNNGILGFFAYYSLYVYFLVSFFEVRKKSKIDSNWLLLVLVMLIIADMTVLTYMEKPNWMIFSIALFIIHTYNTKTSICLRI